jgi:hypothetical protein
MQPLMPIADLFQLLRHFELVWFLYSSAFLSNQHVLIWLQCSIHPSVPHSASCFQIRLSRAHCLTRNLPEQLWKQTCPIARLCLLGKSFPSSRLFLSLDKYEIEWGQRGRFPVRHADLSLSWRQRPPSLTRGRISCTRHRPEGNDGSCLSECLGTERKEGTWLSDLVYPIFASRVVARLSAFVVCSVTDSFSLRPRCEQ